MPITADRVQDTSSAPGTGTTVTITGTPPSGYQSFASAFPAPYGQTFYYTMIDTPASPTLWEVGYATMASSVTFTRDATLVFDGSSGPGVLVNFTSNPTTVFADLPAYAVKRGRWGLTLGQQYFGVLP